MEGESGVVMWVSGVGEMPAVEGAGVVVAGRTGDAVAFVFVPAAGEHLAGCVRRASELALGLAQAGAAVGLAVGPVAQDRGAVEQPGDLGPGHDAEPTAERAGRAWRWAQPGEVVLAWGSQAYLFGEFTSVAMGFVRLISLL
jgi:hypothetical protein